MKLTKRVLALVLAAAMIIGMVAIGAYASITDYYNWDPDTNPYTAKIITKLYLVADGNETEIKANANGKYEVVPGDLIRVETWLQTNYLAGSSTFTPTYSNDIFLPTKNAAGDFETYTYINTTGTGLPAKNLVFDYLTAAPEDTGRDGSFDAPFLYQDAFAAGTCTVGGKYAQIKACYPKEWQGTGTTAANYLTQAGKDANMNALKIAFGATTADGALAKNNAVIVTEPEALFSYYLTVDSAATLGTTGFVGQPANAMTTASVTGNPANVPCYHLNTAKEGYAYDLTSNAFAVAGGLSKKNAVLYVPVDDEGAWTGEEAVKGDIVYDLQNCDIVVVEKHGGGEEPPVPQVDKTALETAINTLPAITQDQATSASWTAYEEALAAAQEVYNNADATQDEVDAAAAALTEATNNVAALGTCDYTELNAAIAAYDALDLTAYTPASVEASAIADAYAAATAIEADLIDDEAGENQAAINAAATALNAAIDALVAKADKAALEAAIATVPAVDKDNATAASWAAYEAALAAANEVNDDANATQADVDAAAAALTEAINNVTALGTCDYTALDAAIAAYDALELNAYTPASVEASEVAAKADAAKAIARDLIDDEQGANQAAIDAAAAALNEAIAALVAKADKTALNTAIATLPAVDEANATAASWAAYAAALEAANTVYADDNATQADVDAAAAALTEATNAVVALGACDYAALDAAIAAYDALDLNAYTPASVANSDVAAKADAAKAIARDMLNDEQGENQAAIDAAAAALNDAIAALVAKADKTALNTAIADAQGKDATAYTPASWTDADLDAVIANAQTVAADDNATQDEVDAQITAIEDAVAKLVAKADKTALEAAIATLPAVDEANATATSWAAYTDALAAAQEVYNDANATQDAVDAAAAALTEAINNVVALGPCDYTALDAAIAAYDALELNTYTPASVEASDVVAKADAAKAVARDLINDETGANQAIINDAAAALNDAIAALVAKADKAALADAIAQTPAVDEANATAASWAAYQDALAAANEVYADDNATQDEVDTAKNNLLAAIDAVAPLGACDYTALDAAIDAYDALDLDAYTPASVEASGIAAAKAAADAVERDMIADEQGQNQAAINAAAQALTDAIDALVAKAEKAALAAAIDAQPAVDKDNATADSWAAYEAALEAANAVYVDDNATQDEVDAAAAALDAAREAIVALGACDYTALDEAIAAYNALDLDAYTPASVEASGIAAAKAAADAVERDMIADEQGQNQAAINAAAQALTDAIAALVAKADKTALEAAIATLPAVDEANATAASWAAYTDALSAAQAIAADENATQTDVDDAADALTNAINGVVALGACDYTALDNAIAAYNALDLSAYTPNSVTGSDVAAKAEAANAVARDLINDEQGANQAAINAAAQALNDAIAALVLKADKTALIAEIDAAPAMDEDTATDDSWAAYQNALNAATDVANDENATTADVETATGNLADAKAALASRDLCDYTALDTALALTPAEAQEAYTASTWAAYADAKAAAEGIARDLINNKAGTNQASINDAAAALTDAFNALKVSTSNVVSVDYDADTYYAKGTMTYTFKVNDAATKIQVINTTTGATQTYDRYHEKVTIKSYNADDEEVDYATTEPAYELWTVDLTLGEGEYIVKAKYGKVWDNEGLEMNIEYATYEPAYTAEAKVGDGDYGKAVEIEAKHGSAVTFKVVTPTDVQKIQLALANGKTSTYTVENAVEEGDTLVWTVTRVFRAADVGECTVKTKSISGWTALDDAVITVSVADVAAD